MEWGFIIISIALTMINKETALLKAGKTMLCSKMLSSPNVDSMVFVNVTIETLADTRLISLMQEET